MLVMYRSEWGEWLLYEVEDDYAILDNAWEEHTSKIKITEKSLEVINKQKYGK